VSVRFYLDHHVDAAITEGLGQRGIDVLTCREDGTETWDDERLLERASALGRVLFSQPSEGVILCAYDELLISSRSLHA